MNALSTNEQTEMTAAAEAIAREAGRLVMTGYRQSKRVDYKSSIDLVTEFDKRSEELIVSRLAATFPGTRIIGEEGAALGSGGPTWYVDPIDGTTNFAHGHPFFCVSLGLWSDTEPLVGVIHAPAIDVTWTTSRTGCLRNGAPCGVSVTSTFEQALVATGFPYTSHAIATDSARNNLPETAALLGVSRGIRRCGSAAMDLAMVADGTYDFYWEKGLNAWDIAAGVALVACAGGRISKFDGESLLPTDRDLVASNGALHNIGLKLLTQA